MKNSETRPTVRSPEAEAAARRAVRNEVLRQAKLGNSVAEWKEGHVVWVTPEEVLARESKRKEGE